MTDTPAAAAPSLVSALLARPSHATEAIEWCEANFAASPHVAELWNTVSSLAFLPAGLSMFLTARRLRLPPALLAAGPLTALTGLASAGFHATLTLAGQRADEVFETLSLVALLHGLSASAPRALAHAAGATAGVLLVSAFLFTELHLITVATLTGVELASVARRAPAAAARVRVATGAALVGAACWLADRLLCDFLSSPALPANPRESRSIRRVSPGRATAAAHCEIAYVDMTMLPHRSPSLLRRATRAQSSTPGGTCLVRSACTKR